MDSWEHPGVYVSEQAHVDEPTGCGLGARPTTRSSSWKKARWGQSPPRAALPHTTALSVSAGSGFNRTDGVGLTIKIKPVGGQANTAKVRLVFPKQLPDTPHDTETSVSGACL